MDDLDKQLAELQLITKGELKQNPNAEVRRPGKKVGPAVPPKPKKPQVYSNLTTIGVPKPYAKSPEPNAQSTFQKENCSSPSSTYANQDGLIYSNILHETKPNPQRGNYSNNDLPPPPLEISSDYVQCNVPPPFPPPPVPSEIDNSLLDDGLPPPPPPITSQSGNVMYTRMNANERQTAPSYQMYDNYNEKSNFYKAQPQVPTNYNKQRQQYNVYSNVAGGHEYSNIEISRNDSAPTYENTRLHQDQSSNQSREFDSHNSILNYPGSSISDYENQAGLLEGRGFRSGSSASRLEYDSESVREPSQVFRSASSASNYIQPHGYDRYHDQSVDSIYAPLGRPSVENDLPPPPPIMNCNKNHPPNLPPIITCGAGNDSLTDEILPPASPVSSSYSELRRATDLAPHHYNPYNPPSHISSTYESIYEPINPRPPSQNSTRSSGYSLYGQNSGKISNVGTLSSGQKPSKELEVDKLTNLLVQGLDSADQDDVYGICVKCNEKIVGEENGCTAMDNFYHIDCFTCSQCDSNLQGKPFYSLDGKPYCEQDYLNTLEKCSVCLKPILDRILRATGKPYHPQCFTCVVCNKSLDGVPFTVDATNQIHCIEDFHKKFAPRCCVCKYPIMPEQGEEETVRVVALDRSFHIGCYKCEDCGLVLSSEAEGRGCYPLDGHVLCKSCNAIRVQALTKHMTTEL